jgi:hypothetical protein
MVFDAVPAMQSVHVAAFGSAYAPAEHSSHRRLIPL